MDAAYVAERVLTVDELKSYVDQDWPAVEPATSAATNGDQTLTGGSRQDSRREIRHLLPEG